MPGLKSTVIDADQDEHVYIRIDTEDRPTLSLDVADTHGRRTLSIRVNGMVVSSLLVDVEAMDTMKDGAWKRFCPYCGEEINFISSKTHVCKTKEPRAAKPGTYWPPQ